MNPKEFAGYLSMVLIFLSAIPYICSILKHETTPTKSSWIIWAVIGFALLVTYRDSGAKATVWAAVAGFINPCVIAILSIKYGKPGWTNLDLVCIGGAILSLVIWKGLSMPIIALVAAIVTDAFGAIPTIRSVWKNPNIEKPLAWVLFSIASLINMFAVEKWEFSLILYPLYMGLASWTIAFPLVKFHWFRQSRAVSS